MGIKEVPYSQILLAGAIEWRPILIASYIGLVVVTSCSLYASARDRKPNERKNRFLDTAVGIGLISMLVSSLSTLVFHLCLSVYVYVWLTLVFAHANWRSAGQVAEFVFGPAAVLVSYGLAILLLLGFIARRSNELQREWWTRYGAWILAAALLGLSLSGIVMGTPWLIHCVDQHSSGGLSKVKWGAIITWLAGTVSGLFAGKSSRTSENSASKSLPLDWVARIGGFLFVIGAMMGMSFVLWTFFRAVSDVPGMGPTSTVAAIGGYPVYLTICFLAVLGLIFSYCFEINIFSLNQLYRNRLVRAYLGATRWHVGMRHPDRFTNFDDELQLHEMRSLPVVTNRFGGDEYRGPFPIFNCSLNLGGSHDLLYQSRHSASFSMTPLYCGASLPSIGYAPTHHFNEGIRLGHAVAVSGAAASPNMGYNTSPLVAFLLSMFNVRLGWWIPNPGRDKWNSKGLTFSGRYLGADLIGGANERSDFLNVSDGGHFENLAIYKMIRRRCKLIIVGDAECDEVLHFGGLANAIRLCATDFGASVEIDVSSIWPQGNGDSLQHGAVGSIKYSDGSIGRIIYLKASITGDEDTTVAQYRDANPTFPHQATANQFFSEEQFESYRRLGRHVVQETFRGTTMSEDLVAVAERMADTLVSRSSSVDSFVAQAKKLDILWERLRGLSTHYSKDFLRELMGLSFSDSDALDNHVIGIGLELLQFMENVFNDLRLEDFWEHADNRGWAMLFMNWARSRKLRRIWRENHQTFGIRFESFCDRRLGLWVEKPVTRV